MKLELAYYGAPVLRQKAKEVEKVTPEIQKLCEDMIETMHHHDGIGLAAPQVYRSLRIFVTCVPKPSQETPGEWEEGQTHIFINPKLLEPSDEAWETDEGCLSIPSLRGNVTRPYRITVDALDIHGRPFQETFYGLEARCIMHENDHINGVLFIDRVRGKERQQLEPGLKALKKKSKR